MDFFTNLFHLFQQGGPVMYILALFSLGATTIAWERHNYYRSQSLDITLFSRRLQELVKNKHWAEARDLCKNTTQLTGKIALQGLNAYEEKGSVKDALEYEASLATSRLRAYLNYLSAIVTLAPLLGLLGTILGMIRSFSILNIQAGQPAAITGGIGEALIATAAGLCVAVLAFVCHTYLSQRVDAFVTQMEEISALVLALLPQRHIYRGDYNETAQSTL